MVLVVDHTLVMVSRSQGRCGPRRPSRPRCRPPARPSSSRPRLKRPRSVPAGQAGGQEVPHAAKRSSQCRGSASYGILVAGSGVDRRPRYRSPRWAAEEPGQARVGDGQGLGPREPPDVLALARRAGPARRRRRRPAGNADPDGCGPRPPSCTSRWASGGTHRTPRRPGHSSPQPGLLARLPPGRLPGGLPRLQVAARLQPQPQPLVAVQDDAARPDDQRRAGHMGGVGLLVEGTRQAAEGHQDAMPRSGLPAVDRPASATRRSR